MTRRFEVRWKLGVTLAAGALALAACGGEQGAGASEAAVNVGSPFGGFYIDGNIPDSPSAGTLGHVTDPDGNSKELGPINGSGTKIGNINTAPLPMLGDTNPNQAVDFAEAWAATNKVGTDIFLYFAWRRDANNGSGFIAWEFQQAAAPAGCTYPSPSTATCNPWANRQPGDFILAWDQQGNSKDIYLRFFALPAGVSTFTFGDPLVLTTAVKLGLGTDYQAAYSSDFLEGEAAVNLSRTVFKPGTCVSIANVIPGTVTGNSDTADYKDAILGNFGITISNCGELKVVKATVPSGMTGLSFPYTVARSGTGYVKYPAVTSLSDTLTGDGDFDLFTNVLDGTDFTLAEGTLPTGWATQSIVCAQGTSTWTLTQQAPNYPVSAGLRTTCTITNKLNLGAVKITKQAIDKALGAGLWPLGGATFTLKKSGTNVTKGSCTTGLDGTCCIDTLLFDTYDLAETGTPAGYATPDPSAATSVVINQVSDCGATPVNAPVARSFENSPLYKLEFTRSATFTSKAGTGVIGATILCSDTPAFPNEPSTAQALTTFSRTRTFDDVALSSSHTSDTYTFSCTVQVDP